MKQKKILIYGYGIDANRTEAVSLNTIRLIESLKAEGWQTHTINIGYPNQAFFTGASPLRAMVQSDQILKSVRGYIEENQITTVVDVFVLPLSTAVFTVPLLRQLPGVKFIKEVHNDAGFSHSFHPETMIRILANNRWLFNWVHQQPMIKFTRNQHLAEKYAFYHIPSPITINSAVVRGRSKKRVSIGYLGHPLKKKGIFEFPKLFELLNANQKKQFVFNFALSDIGNRADVTQILQSAANQHGVKITITGKVKPSVFFRAQDFYLLPLHDQFGAVSSPNTILEAMEAGAIPIVPQIPSLKGIVINGKTGVVTNGYQARHFLPVLNDLISDPARQQRLRVGARKLITKEYDPKRVRHKLKHIL